MAKAKPAVDSKAADEKQSAKMRALQTAIDQIEKAYGAGSIMKLGQTTTL